MEMVSQSCTASETWMMSLLEELEYFLNAPPEVSEGGKPGNQLACRVLRYFRKDGHNWRKKKDGKTVKETHERLKAGRIDLLHCYYAPGEENENFQRCSYWMLEEDLSHVVFVHYREVKLDMIVSLQNHQY
ncbi:calmodulin-binding transcription activator 3-like isoform X5 [Durio zibethinus]|uniref:Calmodulin-binding transcription activator 3-like isoform X5 n=1 Tax=Durio zibethinus TaxID=66656 RepID=A0A6P5YGZ4_DURZI|nr:calmodulin-binding transcription activator 3-like isoform X5 [Durio zibethinus]